MFWITSLSQTKATSVNIPRVWDVVALDIRERADRFNARAHIVK